MRGDLRETIIPRKKGGAEVVPGGMETWARVRSSAYGLMCGSLLPFSRRRGWEQAGFMESTRAAAPFPFRGGNIEGRPAGGGSGFFPGRAAHIGARFRIRARCAGG